MKNILFYSWLILLAACSHPSAIKKQLSGSDSLVINFNEPGSNLIQKTVNTTERNAIKQLISFVDGKSGTAYKCGYDGNLMFYKQGELAGDVVSNYSGDSCRHFLLELDGKLSPTVMSNKAADILKILASGRGWY